MKEIKIHGDSPHSGTVPLGILFALLAALISGISIFYNKLIIVRGIDPLIFNIIKNGGTAIILSLFFLWRRQNIVNKISKDNLWKKLILIGVFGGSIPFILFFQGLTKVAAINANLIQKTLFIWVAILAIPILREKIHPLAIIGYLLVIYANFFIGGVSGFKFSIFEGMILTATILWAIENIIAKKTLKETDSSVVAWGRMTFGVLVLIMAAIVSGKSDLIFKLSPDQAMPILGSIILLTLYVSSWYKALKLAPATTVTAILVLATPITNILSAIFITHNFAPVFTFNTTAITFGVLLISLERQWRSKIAV